ncbi:MAG: carboxypeptidase regulatory-like domain-containing protein [Bacteroidales bacterium]|nr:carboxypeptidase regulatory-like domain-containing protein [Bacteroidales bacterium]MDD3664562.1 carboxypeptidase regulatory-like domain-containing protein [Bacteroidales bacterium]
MYKLLCFLFIAAISMVKLSAQTLIQLGNGVTPVSYPLNTQTSASTTKILILADEITAMGGVAGYISEIRFQTPSGVLSLGSLDVAIGNTDAFAISGAETSGNVRFYNTFFYTSTATQLTIPFWKPWKWDGVSNILIMICSKVNSPGVVTNIAGTPVDAKTSVSALNICTKEGHVVKSVRPNIGLLFKQPNLTGIITDLYSNGPVNGAMITIKSTASNERYHPVTDSTGAFYIWLPDNTTYQCTIERWGYKTISLSVTINNGQTVSIQKMLKPIAPEAIIPTAVETDWNGERAVQLTWGKPELELFHQYDDGAADNFVVMEPGKSYATRFDSLSDGKNQTLDHIIPFLLALPQDDIQIQILNTDHTLIPGNTILSSPYWGTNQDIYSFEWMEAHLDIISRDYVIDGDFYAAITKTGTRIIFLGVDSSPSDLRSYTYDPVAGWQLFSEGNFMIRGATRLSNLRPSKDQANGQPTQPNSISSYEVYRMRQGDEGNPSAFTLLGTTNGLDFLDTTWHSMPDGGYRWSVLARYQPGNQGSEYAYSNVLGMNWRDQIQFITNPACENDTLTIQYVSLHNIVVPDSIYHLNSTSQIVTFPSVWNGTYSLNYGSNQGNFQDTISIYSDTIVNISIPLNILPPGNLSVDTATCLLTWKEQAESSIDTLLWVPFIDYNWNHNSCIYHQNNWEIAEIGQDSLCVRFSWTPQLYNYESKIRFDMSNAYQQVNRKVRISYDIKLDNYATTNENTMSVELNDGYIYTPHQILTSYTNLNGGFDWKHQEFYLNDISEFRFLQFVAEGTNSYDISFWYIDNILVELFPRDARCLGQFDVSVDGQYALTTSDTFCFLPPELVPYGVLHTAMVCAAYPSDTTCAEISFLSGHVPPVDTVWATALGGTGYAGWASPEIPLGSTLTLIGYEIDRNNSPLDFVSAPLVGYTDYSPPDTAFVYGVKVCYKSDPGSDTVWSVRVISDTLTNTDAVQIPFDEDWSSMSFAANNWSFAPSQGNWSIVPTQGKSGYCAAFDGTPNFSDYSFTLISQPLSSVTFDCADILLSFDLKLFCAASSSNFLDIELFSEGQSTILSQYQANNSLDWVNQSFDISQWADAPFQIRFMAHGENSSDIGSWMIDNISAIPLCRIPQSLALAQGNEQVLLSWSSPDCSSKGDFSTILKPWDGVPGVEPTDECTLSLKAAGSSKIKTLWLYHPKTAQQEKSNLLLLNSSGKVIATAIPYPSNNPAWNEYHPVADLTLPDDGKLIIRFEDQQPGALFLSKDSVPMVLLRTEDAYSQWPPSLLWSTTKSNHRNVVGYHVYRDGQRITPVPIPDTTFQDTPGFDLIHEYAVTAVHDGDCESELSNRVYSSLITLEDNQPGLQSIQISPVPADKTTQIKWKKEQVAEINFYSAKGELINTFVNVEMADNFIWVTENLSPGIYMLVIKTNHDSVVRRVCVMH